MIQHFPLSLRTHQGSKVFWDLPPDFVLCLSHYSIEGQSSPEVLLHMTLEGWSVGLHQDAVRAISQGWNLLLQLQDIVQNIDTKCIHGNVMRPIVMFQRMIRGA